MRFSLEVEVTANPNIWAEDTSEWFSLFKLSRQMDDKPRVAAEPCGGLWSGMEN